MNYTTLDYNESRITPAHSLKLPVGQPILLDHGGTPPRICNGLIYQTMPHRFAVSVNEATFECVGENHMEPYVKGAFGFSYNSYLLESANGKVCELSSEGNQLISEFDLGVLSDPSSLMFDDAYYVMRREERGDPECKIELGQKEPGRNAFCWTFTPPGATISEFALKKESKALIVKDYKGGVYRLNGDSGEVIWQRDVKTIGILTEKELSHRSLGALSTSDSPHIYKDTVSFGYLFSYMAGMDINTGELKWKRKIFGESVSYTTVTDQGRLYYFSHNPGASKLYVIDCETGESINEFDIELSDKLDERFTSSIYSDVTDTHFWGAGTGGLLYAINLETGKLDWYTDLQARLTGMPIFICNNRLYVPTQSGQFVLEGAGGYIPD